MGTTRERREARAERLRGWAGAREAKQGALNEAARADEAATGIPFGQPILRGHHSQRRHERVIERLDRAMGAAVENGAKARSMNERADNIEAATANSIFTDDPDAKERLTEKIAKLEAQRDAMKARNAEYRKANREELKGLTAYGRDQALPFPSWAVKNATANIGRLRKRLEGLDAARARQAAGRVITARYGGTCEECGADIERGQQIRYSRQDGARCVECPTTNEEE
jgi:DNA repair exonuclease SbcCD ATPase subunit